MGNDKVASQVKASRYQLVVRAIVVRPGTSVGCQTISPNITRPICQCLPSATLNQIKVHLEPSGRPATTNTLKSSTMRAPVLLIALFTATRCLRSDNTLHQSAKLDSYCWIDGHDVQCDSQYSGAFDLAVELGNLSKRCNESCHFANLFIKQSLIRALDSADFAQLSFDSVHVYSAGECSSIDMKCRQEEAVTTQLRKQLFLNGPSKLASSSVNRLLSECTGLEQAEMALQSAILHRISPCEAMSHQQRSTSKLKYLVYRPNDYEIEIGDYAFDCPIRAVQLANIPIRRIATNALRTTGSNRSLAINLANCHLTDSVLQLVALGNLGRATVLILDNNLLTQLPSDLEQFLETGEKNIVSMYGNRLNCLNLKPYVWLLRDKEKYRDRVWGAKCSTSESIFDLQLYDGKCAFRANERALHCENIVASDFNIRQEVVFLQQIMDIQLERLHSLIVANCTVTQITDNTLNSVPVSQVQLADLVSLKHIASGSFVENSLQSLSITGANQISITDVLLLVRKQANLQRLTVSLAAGTEHSVPKNAFIALNHALKLIQFKANNGSAYRIVSVGSHFIAKLTSLQSCSFSGVAISEIETEAFASNKVTREALLLNLSNCKLDETKFRNQPFDKANRPLTIDLSHNSVRILAKESFDFLLFDAGHLVDLTDNPIACQFGRFSSTNEHPYYWIYSNREQLRRQLLNAKCQQEGDLFEYLQSLFDSPNSSVTPALTMIWSMVALIVFFCFS